MPDPSAPVESNSLRARLERPARGEIAGENLADIWFDQTIRVRLGGAAHLVHDPELMNHFRRSLGGALGAGASPECAATHPPSPCPWEPPCALDVFFREQMRIGGDGLPKPFVMHAEADGEDLIAGLRLFGFAADWAPTVEHSLVDALQNRLPWKKRLRIAPPPLIERWIETCEGLDAGTPPDAATLKWLTPFDAEKIDASEKTGSILTRLHRRLQGMARWHDADLLALEDAAVASWEEMASVCADIRKIPGRSSLNQRGYVADAMHGSLTLQGNLTPFWPLLLMCERCSVGRGATRGRGRYALR